MTPQDVINDVRPLIQDETATYRYSDAMLLGFVNRILKQIALLRPDLFTVTASFATTAGAITQTLPAGSLRLIEVSQVVGGNAIEEVVREIYDRVHPGWTADTAGTPKKYMRHPRNPVAFHLHPKPAADVEVVVEYASWPSTYTIDQSITAPSEGYFPVVVDGVVWLAESIDNEHVESGRAKMFYDSMIQQLGMSAKAREITDTEAAATGLPPFS